MKLQKLQKFSILTLISLTLVFLLLLTFVSSLFHLIKWNKLVDDKIKDGTLDKKERIKYGIERFGPILTFISMLSVFFVQLHYFLLSRCYHTINISRGRILLISIATILAYSVVLGYEVIVTESFRMYYEGLFEGGIPFTKKNPKDLKEPDPCDSTIPWVYFPPCPYHRANEFVLIILMGFGIIFHMTVVLYIACSDFVGYLKRNQHPGGQIASNEGEEDQDVKAEQKMRGGKVPISSSSAKIMQSLPIEPNPYQWRRFYGTSHSLVKDPSKTKSQQVTPPQERGEIGQEVVNVSVPVPVAASTSVKASALSVESNSKEAKKISSRTSKSKNVLE